MTDELGQVGRWRLEARLKRAEAGLLLPGWDCPSCRAFNGSAKELLTRCRCCDAAKHKD